MACHCPVRCFAALLVASALSSTPTAAASAVLPQAVSSPAFVDLIDVPYAEANWDRFHHLEDALAAAFFRACTPGRCARYPLLWPMQLRCAVRRLNAHVAACRWIIAGSDLQVQATGGIAADVVLWRCPLPIGESLDVDAFHAALSVADPLQVRLPAARQSLQDALLTCLAQPGSTS